jgi:anti-anti-sigma regulatory factor
METWPMPYRTPLTMLENANGQLVLDFSSVRRLDATALRAMEQLAGIADEKGARLALRGVNVDVYRVLKLVKLAPRFAFLT